MVLFTHWLKCLAIALAANRQTRQKPEENSRKIQWLWVVDVGGKSSARLFALPAKVVFPMRSHEHRHHIDLHTF